jgi:PAS domain S-box-containing protein
MGTKPQSTKSGPAWPDCRGPMAGLIRAHQWRVTPLGPIESWPQSLRTAVELMLQLRQPAYVGWGRMLITLYNDASIAVLGPRHPDALGKAYAEVWSESWNDLRPVIEAVMAGEPQHVVGQRVRRPQQGDPASWYTYSWAPLHDDKGQVAGFLCIATETTLQLVDEQLRMVLENARDAVNMLDLRSGRYVYLSPANAAITGFSVEELHNISAAELWKRTHPDDREIPSRQIEDLRNGTQKESVAEFRWQVKSGEYRWFSVSRKLVLDPGGQPVALVGVSRDITERKQADLEMLAGRAKLEAALRSMIDAAYISDAQGRFLHVNDAFASFYRYNCVEDCPRTFAEFADGFDITFMDGRPAPPDHRPVPRALRGETAVAAEYRLRRKDSGETWIGSFSFGPIRERDGRVSGAVVTARDITEQRRAEVDLRLSEKRYRLLHESLRDGYVQVSMDGHILDCNEIYCRMLGYAADEIRTMTSSDLTPERWHAFEADIISRQIIRRGYSDVYEKEYRAKDGTVFPVELRTILSRDAAGNPDSMWAIVRDISERKADEARLQSLKDELIHVGRVSELSQVSAGIAHELNQPLAAMLNYTSLARRMIARKDSASISSAQMSIEKAGEQAARAGEIIRRMRDFVEKRDTNRLPDTINVIVEEAVALALIGAKAAGIATHLELSPELPAILADRIQIQQVLVNLLRNAVDAMASSPRRELALTTRSRNGGVEVIVADTGSGIPENVAGRLFQPFVTTKPGGMGIGLAISRSIIEAHGGDIAVEPNPGGGTVFRFTLPYAPMLA